jgi:hypothetical protein
LRDFLLNQDGIPKLPSRSSGSLFSRHTTRNQFLDLLIEMLPDLFREIIIEAAS